MKDRECNSVFADEVSWNFYHFSMTLGNEELSERIRKFIRRESY